MRRHAVTVGFRGGCLRSSNGGWSVISTDVSHDVGWPLVGLGLLWKAKSLGRLTGKGPIQVERSNFVPGFHSCVVPSVTHVSSTFANETLATRRGVWRPGLWSRVKRRDFVKRDTCPDLG